MAVDRLDRADAKRADVALRLANYEAAMAVARSVAVQMQAAAHVQITTLVNRCLEAIFPDPYEFRIVFEEKRGKTEARLVFVRDGLELDPLTMAGGGVVDVAAFGLRLAALALSRPALRRVLVLDEPWRFLSVQYRPAMRALVLALATELGFQFVYVTHDPAFVAGDVVEVGGESNSG